MNEREERLVCKLTEAVEGLTLEVCGLRAVLANGTVSRSDLAASEARIVKAFGERISPAKLDKLTNELEKASEPLKKAVAENQPD